MTRPHSDFLAYWPELRDAKIRLGVAGPYRDKSLEQIVRNIESARARARSITARWKDHGVVAVALCDVSRRDSQAANPLHDQHWRNEILEAIRADFFRGLVLPHFNWHALTDGQCDEARAALTPLRNILITTDRDANRHIANKLLDIDYEFDDADLGEIPPEVRRRLNLPGATQAQN